MLKDARGYRSPYINALNGAVAAARVVGGDVVPEETPSGTILTIAQTRRAGRFELFCGYDEGGESGADALCLSDGTLYVSAVAQELKPGRDVFRRDGELQPRASGWCTQKTIKDGETLTFACVRYKGQYYLIAQKDGESVSELLPENLGEIDPALIEELFTFGQFYWAGKTGDKSIQIRQDVHGDVWYGGEGGVAQEETPYAWRVRAVALPEPEPETPEEGGAEGGGETPEEPQPEEQSFGFQVFAPFAVISQATLPTVPDGFTASATWQDIPKNVLTESSSGTWTLYAILKYTPGVPASGSGSSATPAQPAKTEFFLSSTLPDTSNDPAGTQYRLFHIASRAADGTLTQIQAGPIVETFPQQKGEKGDTGPQGAPGEPGTDGKDGEDGATYTPSLRTETGTGGGVYLDFTNSKTGIKTPGDTNLKGPKGDKGDTGDPGDPGKDGATYIPSQRSGSDIGVYLDFKNSETGNIIRGVFNLRGPYYIPSLRTETGTGGGVYLDFKKSETNELIEGSVDLRGPQGEQGTTGPQGAPGAPGKAGEDGATYTPSLREVTGTGGGVYLDFTNSKTNVTTKGTVNLKGPKGDTGPQGPNGPTGPQGPKGDKGDTGPQGPAGAFTGTPLSITVVTGVKYDPTTHKLTYTRQTINFYGTSIVTESDGYIATATAHSEEHK